MYNALRSERIKLRSLLASSSVAALLIGGGAPAALAASCTSIVAVPYDNPHGTTVANVCIVGSNAGNVSNEGAITPSGVAFVGGQLSGELVSSGTIAGGISLDSASEIVAPHTAIHLTGAAFGGGITNAGFVGGSTRGIYIETIGTFSGGISNNGNVNGQSRALQITLVPSFSGDIFNGTAGVISSTHTGILISDASTINGNIINNGKITAGTAVKIADSSIVGSIIDFGNILGTSVGISIDSRSAITSSATAIQVRGSTFTGGITNAGAVSGSLGIVVATSRFIGNISNSGTISATSSGIVVSGVSRFSGAIVNAGTISAGGVGIGVSNVLQFGDAGTSGGISNSGTITGAIGIAVAGVSSFSGDIVNSAGGTIAGDFVGILVGATPSLGVGAVLTFSAGITNAGQISAEFGILVGATTNGGGIGVSTFAGSVSNSGTISAGYGIVVGGFNPGGGVSYFSGNINNSGLIAADDGGIVVINVSTFLGGVTNSGTITASNTAIVVAHISTFSGSVVNASTGIITANVGMIIDGVSTFAGGVSNAGTIVGGERGIVIASIDQFGSSSAGGGVTNTGTITTSDNQGIRLRDTVSLFYGGITNAGTISADFTGIEVNAQTFTGGISNSGLIAADNSYEFGIAVSGVVSFFGGISNTAGTIAGGTASGYGIYLKNISTFSGNITNAAVITAHTGIYVDSGVTFAPGSAIVNTGNIIGTGGIAINASAATSPVTIDQYGGTINGAIDLSAYADVVKVTAGTILGDIVGQGTSNTVNFAPPAGNTFTYTFDFTGIHQVNVDSGTVVLNGAANSATFVDVDGGTLAGIGNITATTVTIHSGGTFAPGTSGVPGTSMTINGNLAFQSAAVYMVQLNATATTYVTVNGAAALAGNVHAEVVPGSALLAQYDILHTSGGLGGTRFNAVTMTGAAANYSASLSYSATDVYLNTSPSLGNGSGLNQNQQAIANAINNVYNNAGALPPSFLDVYGLTGGALGNALNHLSGEVATGGEGDAFALMNDFLNLMLDPTVDGRDGAFGSPLPPGLGPQASLASSMPLAFDAAADSPFDLAPGEPASGPLPPPPRLGVPGLPAPAADTFPEQIPVASPPPPPPPTFDQRWRAWGSGFGGYGQTAGNATVGSHDVNTNIYGFAGGLDYHATPHFVVGFALSGAGTNWGLASDLGSGRSDAFQAGIHTQLQAGRFYFAAAAAFANHWITTSRTAFGGEQLNGNFTAQDFGGRIEAGARIGITPKAGITPYVAGQGQMFRMPSYAETSAGIDTFGLSFNNMNAFDVRSEVGARWDILAIAGNVPVILRGRAAWAHDWVTDPSLEATFESLPAASFTVNGATPPSNSALASASAQIWLSPSWSLTAKFYGEFALGSQSYAGNGTLRYTW